MAKNNFTGDIVLGMHDALVSVTGLVTGLAFTLADRYSIIMSAIIASVTASLSMAASNYLAMRANNQNTSCALKSGMHTGAAYMLTCVVLILPFLIIYDAYVALVASIIIAVLVIFAFNLCIGRMTRHPWMRRFIEMLGICAGVSVVAYLIGEAAKNFLGIYI